MKKEDYDYPDDILGLALATYILGILGLVAFMWMVVYLIKLVIGDI